jgi:hypothetical protein
MTHSAPRGNPILYILLTVGCLLASHSGLDGRRASATSRVETQKEKIRRELGKAFKRYELLRLDHRRAAEEVVQTGRLTLATSEGAWEIILAPHEMRARVYRATKVGTDGVLRTLDRAPARTYKGFVAGSHGSQARLTVDGGRVEGLIIKDGERYYVEPARNLSASASATDYLFYRAADVIQDSVGACGLTLDEKVSAAGDRVTSSSPAQVFSPFRTVELATEADHEYVSAHGGAAGATGEILSIMNQVEGIYETQLGITFQIVYQNAWETSADPYASTSDSVQIVGDFRDYWNANFTHVARDIAHLWTGKNMGGVLGRAWIGVACNIPSLAYGVSRDDGRVPLKYNTPAHEIGHNLGASHADGVSDCEGSIMRPTTISGLTFCQFSRAEITRHVEQFGHCLTAVAAYSIGGQVTDINGRPVSGVSMRLSGAREASAQTDAEGRYSFADLTAGESYTITPSKALYIFSPQGQTFTALGGDQSAHFTVTASPDGPLLATEASSTRAIALDSVTLLRDPFAVFTPHNFSHDRRTRVVFFAVNVTLLPGENVSAVRAQAVDARGKTHPLTVEAVEKVPGLDWLAQVFISLPDELGDGGDVRVSISLRGAASNQALVSISPAGNAAP